MSTREELKQLLLTQADYWRTLIVAGETPPTMLSVQVLRNIEELTSGEKTPSFKLFFAVGNYTNTGDRAELDALLAELDTTDA